MRSLCTRTAVMFLAVVMALVVAASAQSGPAITAGFSAIPGSFRSTTDAVTGEFSSPKMTVDVVLAPSHASELSELLANVYDPKSESYRHWLGKGEFYSRFAPTAAQTTAMADYLRASGLVVEQSSSPFLLRASGSSSVVAAAFRTSLLNYRNPKGTTYFSNASPVQLPASLASGVLGVVGLSNTVRLQSHVVFPWHASPPPPPPNCETPYPTVEQLIELIIDGEPLSFGYGGGPGCSGLTPSQDNSIYGAPNVGAAGKGAGADLAVFELSAYQHSDIVTWTQYFYGWGYTPPLVDIDVDGGPLNPICPPGDACNPASSAYNGDIEVDADIETQLAIAPDAHRIFVYNAPNDYTGQTSLDEYTKIANDDIADEISTSWGECENDAGAAYVQAENLIFEQIALQGQSMFAAAGDDGAFDCLTSTTIVNVDDPGAQPWVTDVGGTSFESFNPGTNPNPSYPTGVETVWNVGNLCNTSQDEGGQTGYFWCANTGAGGGGSSQFWGRPSYQSGPGVDNPYTTYGNGTTHCSLAPRGAPCREVPDVSANADEFTGYAEYCTGNANTPGSACTFSSSLIPPGWFEIGGTSLSSPLWAAIIADHDSYFGGRIGNANPLLYRLFNSNYQGYFNDITGIHQTTNNNGLFPTTPGYDLATGIGTPIMGALITLVPQR